MAEGMVEKVELSAAYDRASDVLYISRRPIANARSREDAPGLVWRYGVERGDLIGATIIDLGSYWRLRRGDLVERIAVGFEISYEEAQAMIDKALGEDDG